MGARHPLAGRLGILTPDCPVCGEPPALVVSEVQAACGNDHCRALFWNPRREAAEQLADEHKVDLTGLSGMDRYTAQAGGLGTVQVNPIDVVDPVEGMVALVKAGDSLGALIRAYRRLAPVADPARRRCALLAMIRSSDLPVETRLDMLAAAVVYISGLFDRADDADRPAGAAAPAATNGNGGAPS